MADRVDPAPKNAMPKAVICCDRLCHACGMNLVGCLIESEPRYDLRIVRCPNCAAVTALEEYPPVARWGARWSALLAGLLTVFMLALAIGGLAMCALTPLPATGEATERMEGPIRDGYMAWRREHAPDDVQSSPWLTDWSDFEAYWLEHGDGVLASLPPWHQFMEWDEFTLNLVPILTALGVGMVWSVLLLGRPRRRLLIAAAVLLFFGLLILGAVWTYLSVAVPDFAGHIVWQRLALPLVAIVYVIVAATFAFGLVLGRPVIRGLLRLLLPARAIGALALLWTADGRPVPRPHLPEAPR